MVGVGVITTEQALALGVTGPILRSTGFAWDLRNAQPYLAYDEVDFDVIYTENGDCFDRYRIRLYEIAESIKIVRQCVERMPRRRLPRAGQEGDAAAARAHRRVDGSADPPLQALHRGLPGARGRDLRRRSSRRAVRSVATSSRDGTGKPARLHIRGPSFYNLASMTPMMENRLVADAVAVDLERRPDHGRGGPVMAFTAENREIGARDRGAVPVARSAILPLLHLAQEQDGWVSPGRSARSRGSSGSSPREVLGTCSFYTMFKRDGAKQLVVSVCTNVSCLVNGGPELLEQLSEHYADADDVTVEEVECLAACGTAPVFQVNYEFHGNATGESATVTIDEYRSGTRVARGVSGGKRA